MSARASAPDALSELRKVPAFFRRDLLVMWSYRLAFFWDWANIAVQLLLFNLIGRMVDPSALPSYGGRQVSYFAFVAIGIAVASFLQVTTSRLASAIRTEQLAGTLEAVLVTPTSPATFQLGSIVYDLAYVPIRLTLFLVVVGVVFGVEIASEGLLPAVLVLCLFIVFAWGLGTIGAAAVLTFKRGGVGAGLLVFLMTIASESYVPSEVLPGWLQPLVAANPLSVTLEAMRESLLGGAPWGATWPAAAVLVPWAVASLAGGILAFRMALRRERRRGTLALY